MNPSSPATLPTPPSPHVVQAVLKLENNLRISSGLNAQASDDLKALGTVMSIDEDEIGDLMMACHFNLMASHHIKVLKARLGISDAETVSFAGSAPVSAPVLTSSTPYRYVAAQPEVTNLYDVGADDEALNHPAGAITTDAKKNASAHKGKGKAKEDTLTKPTPEASSSTHHLTTSQPVIAKAPSASTLWPESAKLKAMGAKLAVDIRRTKDCSNAEARALLEEVLSDARTHFLGFQADWAQWAGLRARYNDCMSRFSDAANNQRRSFEERIGVENWTQLLELDAACREEEGDGAAALSTFWLHAHTGK